MDDLLTQLDQLHQALQAADEESKPGIQQLINDIQELLGASSAYTNATPFLDGQDNAVTVAPPEDDEFQKFQAEIAALDSSNQNHVSSDGKEESIGTGTGNGNQDEVQHQTQNIEDELKALEGMKCLAPFEVNWGQVGYYSGIILCVDHHDEDPDKSDSDITVRVVFTQPIVENMRPCEFFIEGRCRFEDNQCKFSHGETVPLSQLREYKDPDYSKVIPGAKVLAKYSDGLWYKASVTKITDKGECEVTYHSYKDQLFTIPIHETCPYGESENSETDSTSEDDDECSNSLSNEESEDINEKDAVLFIRVSASTPLGEWERHTRGIGSKLMAKMGYVLGTGLGKNSEGRVNPVDAIVLPPGRSLDRCMELKEKAGTSGANLFSVERRLKRQKKKQEQRAQAAEKKQVESQSVFNFLNSSLNLKKSKHHRNHKNQKNRPLNYKKESCKDLSKNLLTIGNSIKSVEKDISKCKESIKRHEGRDKTTVDKLKEKLNVLKYQLSQFRNNETLIAKEQSNRDAKKKLEVF